MVNFQSRTSNAIMHIWGAKGVTRRAHIQSVNFVIRLNYVDAAVAKVHSHSNINRCNSHLWQSSLAATTTADGNGTCSRIVISGIADLVALIVINKLKIYMRKKCQHTFDARPRTNKQFKITFIPFHVLRKFFSHLILFCLAIFHRVTH